jgi:hypothetical protein
MPKFELIAMDVGFTRYSMLKNQRLAEWVLYMRYAHHNKAKAREFCRNDKT